MTLGGTMAKTGILFLILMVTSVFSWMSHNIILMLVGLAGGIVLGIMTPFKREWAPITAPIYAAFEGLLVGGLSYFYAASMAGTKYSGAVPLAIAGTILVFGLMLALYSARIIKVTSTFMMAVFGATAAIAVLYLGTMLIGFFNKGIYNMPIYSASPIGIIFSIVVIGIAALNLAIDFKVIEDGCQSGAPSYMEWYAGFGLLVTLVWIYLEILRLISKFARR